MSLFAEGQMVRCVANVMEPKYVGAVGQVLRFTELDAMSRIMAAAQYRKDPGRYVYEVKFAGFEAQFCSSPTCKRPHYAICFEIELEPINDPDEHLEHEHDEELVAS